MQDPDVVSTSLKVISLRIRGVTSELQEMGESVDDVVNTSKLQAQIKALTGVDIVGADGAFRSTYDILVDIGKVYNELDSMSQSGVLELLAGKQRANALGAILTQIDTVEDAYTSALESDGSAAKELETYLDSIQGKLDQFNNAVQSMWSNTLNSDWVKSFVEFGTEIIKIIDGISLLGTALIAIASISMIKNKMGPIAFIGGISDGIRDVFGKIGGFITRLAGATTATSTLTAATLEQAAANGAITTSEAIRQATTNGLVLSQVSLTDAEAMAALSTTALNEAEKQAIVSKLGLSGAATTLTMATLGQAVAEGKITAAEAAHLGTATGLMAAQTSLTATKAAEILTSQELSAAHAQELAAKLGLTTVTSTLNAAKIQQLTIDGILTPAESALALSLLATGGAAESAAGGFAALRTALRTTLAALWPTLAVIAGVAAIYGVVKLVDWLVVTTEELTEELDELKIELSNLESEIDEVNSELETMEERIAELLAKDSLTFTEDEELKRLQAENSELQRKLDLLEQEKQFEQEKAARKFNETMSSANSDDYYVTGQKKEWWNYIVDGMAEAIAPGSSGATTNLQGVLDNKIKAYKNYAAQLADIETRMADTDDKDEYDELKKEKERIDGEMLEIQTYVTDKIKEMNANAEGLEYFTGDNLENWQIESNKNLDKIKNFEDKWAIIQNGTNATTNAITRIFNKDEYKEVSDTIDDLVEKLKDDPNNADLIAQIGEQCEIAEKDLQAVGLSADIAAEYFSKIGQEANFSTLEGKIKDITTASTAMTDTLNGLKTGSIDIDTLFDSEGKIIQTKLSELFQGTSEQTRKDATKILENAYEGIADGLDDSEIETLMGKFGLKLSASLLDIKKTLQAESNLELFPNLEEEINGIIDTFNELSSAVNNIVDAMDLLDKARAEEAYSGSISLETMMKLMEYTDDYTKIMEIDEYGAIKLVAGAEDVLVEAKLARIKEDAELAVQSAEVAYQDALTAEQEAIHAEQTVNVSSPAQEWYRDRLGDLASMTAYVGSLWDSITSGNIDGMFDRASAAATQAKVDKAAGYEEEKAKVSAAVATAQSNVATTKKARDTAAARNNWVQGLTPDNLKAKTNSDDASGGADDPEEVTEKAFQKEMDYWENRIAANQAKSEQVQHEIDMFEAKGQKAGAQYYQEQIRLENERLDLLAQQKAAAEEYLATLEPGSEEWWEVANILNDIEGEMDDATASIQDFNDAMADTHWYIFDEAHDRVSDLTSDLENIRDILSNEKLFDDEGNFTKEGLGFLASYVEELGVYEGAMANAKKEMELFGDTYDPNKTYVDAHGNDLSIDSEQDWYDAAKKAEEKYDEWNQKAIETKYNIKDLYEQQIDAVEEYTDTLVDSYNDYIDSVKEALSAERD